VAWDRPSPGGAELGSVSRRRIVGCWRTAWRSARLGPVASASRGARTSWVARVGAAAVRCMGRRWPASKAGEFPRGCAVGPATLFSLVPRTYHERAAERERLSRRSIWWALSQPCRCVANGMCEGPAEIGPTSSCSPAAGADVSLTAREQLERIGKLSGRAWVRSLRTERSLKVVGIERSARWPIARAGQRSTQCRMRGQSPRSLRSSVMNAIAGTSIAPAATARARLPTVRS
jgi:hypothetical protein